MRLGALYDALPSISLPGNLQQRALAYVVHKALRPFVDVQDDALALQLTSGRLTLRHLSLKQEAVNERLAPYGLALVSGTIDHLELSIPWTNLLAGHVSIHVSGLHLELEQGAEATDLAESDEELGVGAPEAMQRLLQTVLQNMTVEASHVTVALGQVEVEVQRIEVGPADGTRVTISDVALKTRVPSPASSVSEESDAPELMQSTLFEGSLYQSALDAFEPQALLTCKHGLVLLYQHETGFDVKCRPIRLAATLAQLTMLQELVNQPKGDGQAPSMLFSLERLDAAIQIRESTLDCTLQSVSFDVATHRGHCDASLSLDGQSVLSQQAVRLDGGNIALGALTAHIPVASVQQLLSRLETRPQVHMSETRMQVTCPSMTLFLDDAKIELSKVTYHIQSTPVRTRHSLHCHATITLPNINMTLDDTILDYTQSMPSTQRKLDFDRYDTLFAEPGRTEADDAATVQAVKERFKSASHQVFRASIARLSVTATPQALNLLPKEAGEASSGAMSCFIEIERIDVVYTPFSLSLGQVSVFLGHGVKDIDVLIVEAAAIKLDADMAILTRGRHCNRSSRMLSLKVRRNLGSNQVMVRLGLADVCFEYYPDMPWLDVLANLPQSPSSSQPPTLAIDLENVSIALHPYVGKALGLLYFRRAAANSAAGPISLHAGILEFFLIDEESRGHGEGALIDCMLKLGFVHAASIETVEVTLAFGDMMDVALSGAILTLQTCPDSTQTLIQLFAMLRLPLEMSQELKYRLGLNADGTIPLDVFQSIDESAFKNMTDAHEPVLLLEDDETDAIDAMDATHLSKSLVDLHRQASKPNATKLRVRLDNCFFIWNLYDGYDWQRTQAEINTAVQGAIVKAQTEEKVGDLLFNSIYLALPRGTQAQEVTAAINEEIAQETDTSALRLGRSSAHKVRCEISGISLTLLLMDALEGEVVNHLTIGVAEVEIFDNLATSTWRKFLTALRSADGSERTAGSKLVMLDIMTVRPVAGLAAAELIIKANLLPLRLHVDQDTLEFMTRFFSFRDETQASVPAEDIFIQRFEIMPFKVQIDYKPKRVNLKSLRSGRTTEFKNFFILEDSLMVMRHVVLYGVCGLPRVFELLEEIWLAHIKAHQLGSVLAGVSAIRSLASFGGSLKKLVTVPVQEYRRDGQLVRGVQKGISAFARSTGTEAVRLGAKLAIGTQGLLEQAEGFFVEPPSAAALATAAASAPKSLYADQPENLRQGVSQAMQGISRNVAAARTALAAMPGELDAEEDARGAVRVAARSVPIAVIRPLIGTTEAISKTLLGLRNSMEPGRRKMNQDKYK